MKRTRTVKQVREVADDKPVRKVKKVKRVKLTDDTWTAPMPHWKRLCLCAYVPPSKRHLLPWDEDEVCELESCPCPQAEKHAIEIPDNIVRTSDK